MSKTTGNTNIVDFKSMKISELCREHLALKAQANEIADQLDAVREQLVEAVGVKDEGSQSFHIEGFKITTSRSISRTVDAEEARKLLISLGDELHEQVFTYKPSLNLARYRAVKELRPDVAGMIDSAVTSRPGKASVKVVEDEA